MWTSLIVLGAVVMSASGSSQFASSFSSSSSASSSSSVSNGGMSSSSACFSSQIGFSTGNTKLFAFNMEPQKSEFAVKIPEYPGCVKVGVSVSICETGNVSTQAQLANFGLLHVRRNGDVSKPGKGNVVIYCR